MIGHLTFKVWQTVAQNFTLSLAHKMAGRLDIEDFFRQIDPDLCQYVYAFCKTVKAMRQNAEE